MSSSFLWNLYLFSKACAFFNGNLSEEFSINCGVRQGCSQSPILFNLFINDVLDNCDRYDVYLESHYCCGGTFCPDDIVLVTPSKTSSLRKFWIRFMNGLCYLKMKWLLELKKCATLVVNYRLTLLNR